MEKKSKIYVDAVLFSLTATSKFMADFIIIAGDSVW